MASPAFRQEAHAGAGTAANLTIALPTGTLDGDFMLAQLSKDSAADSTAPAGWNLISVSTTDAYYTGWWWKIASGEASSGWTWAHPSVWRTGYVASYSGDWQAAPLDPTVPPGISTAASTRTLTTAAVTTLTPETIVLTGHAAINVGGAWSSGAGTTPRVAFDEVHLQEITQASSGTFGGYASGYSAGSVGAMKAIIVGVASTAAGAAAARLILTRTLMGVGR